MKLALRLLLILIISTASNANFASPYKAPTKKMEQQKIVKPFSVKPKVQKKKAVFFSKSIG